MRRLIAPLLPLTVLTVGLVAPTVASAGFAKTPWLQMVDKDSIFICWESDTSEVGTIDWGADTGLGTLITETTPTLVHQIEITGLSSGTEYHYKVTSGGQISDPGSFKTAVQDEQPFSFVVVGDTRTDGDGHTLVVNRVISTVGYPQLYFNTGDLVEDGGDISQWGDFFSIEAKLLANSPLFPTPGNHDDVVNDSIYSQLFHLPDNASSAESYYAVTYGNTRFIVVDTNDDYTFNSPQHDWLEAELTAANADPAIEHKMVFFHHAAFTSGAHGVFDTEDWTAPRTYLHPTFNTYDVDVVFNGHDHHYERSDPSQTDGVLYIVTGGGGAPASPADFVDGIGPIVEQLIGMDEGETAGEYVESSPIIKGILNIAGYGNDYEEGWWRAEAEVIKHFVEVEVYGGKLTGNVYDFEGNLIDTWTVGSSDPNAVDDDGDSYTELEGDCDDADAAVHPNAPDECDSVDWDCDGSDECGSDTEDTEVTDDTDVGDDTDDGGGSTGRCGCANAGGLGWAGLILPAALAIRRRR